MLKTSPGDRAGQTTLGGLVGRVPADSDVPSSLHTAVRFMLGGAAVSILAGVFYVIAVISDPTGFNDGKALPSGGSGRLITWYVVTTVVYVALWVVMARMNRSGQRWARIVATVLFAIATYDLYSAVNSLQSGQEITVINIIAFALSIAEWLCAVGAIAMMWRPEATVYYKARSAAR